MTMKGGAVANRPTIHKRHKNKNITTLGSVANRPYFARNIYIPIYIHCNMKQTLILAALLAAAPLKAATHNAPATGKMERNFRHVPDSQPLAVYWYWMAGQMTADGVVKDLQAMKQAGINRVQIGMIGNDQGVPQGPVRMFTPEWWHILHTMFRTAGELGIEVGLFNCPGWSQSGGPWVKPSQAMRYLATAADTVQGPAQLTAHALPTPGEHAQDVRCLAYPIREEGQTRWQAQDPVSTSQQIRLTAAAADTARSLTLQPARAGMVQGKLMALGEKDGAWHHVADISADRTNTAINVGFQPLAPVVVSLPETRAREFRLELAQAGSVSAVTLSAQPRVESYAEKTFAKMWPTPHPMWDAYLWRPQPQYDTPATLQPAEVRDITPCLAADGTLTWQVPRGRWVILRTAMLPTGSEDAPAPEEGRGLETDKMSREHIRAHFDSYIGEILRRIPAEDRKTFRIVVEDSYETGGQNWTDNMIGDFRKAYGYDPTPWLPAFSGITVGSQEQTDRFLWDVRRLVADEVSFNYVGGLREVSNEHGLTTWLENYGHWGFPGEFLQYGSQSDEIGGEFWSFGTLGDIENRSASSCGHIYGKAKVWAESFTCGGPDFTQYPGQMKQRGDRFFTEGINATLLHLYIQQPDDRLPGINANFGNEFNRNNTWFSQMDVFARYLKRCNYMLQQGRYVADVAYFLGEDAPKMTGVRQPEIPKGYSYDYVNADVLMDATVSDGMLQLRSGMQYSVLVLPRISTMRPALLARLQQLVSEGLTLIGPAPDHSPSLQDWPQADRQVRQMAADMWQTATRPYAAMLTLRQGPHLPRRLPRAGARRERPAARHAPLRPLSARALHPPHHRRRPGPPLLPLQPGRPHPHLQRHLPRARHAAARTVEPPHGRDTPAPPVHPADHRHLRAPHPGALRELLRRLPPAPPVRPRQAQLPRAPRAGHSPRPLAGGLPARPWHARQPPPHGQPHRLDHQPRRPPAPLLRHRHLPHHLPPAPAPP